jgi:hypothetical protein
VLPEGEREPRESRDRGRGRGEKDERPGQADVHAQRGGGPARQRIGERLDDPHERRLQPLAPERRLTALDRERRDPDDRDQRGQRDDEPDRGEEAARERPPGLTGLLREVGNGLEPREREHRERQRERELVPRGRDSERDAFRERVRREEEREPEHDEQELRGEVEARDGKAGAVQLRAAGEAEARDAEDDGDGDDDVPRRLPQRVDAKRRAQVVRQKQGRKRDHDHVVEEERPAGEEAERVVVGAPDEGRGAARLRDRRRALRVRERDDEKEDPRAEEDERRQAERVGGDDPEREVEGRGDLAVRDREERRCVERALEAAELAGHLGPPPAKQGQPAGAERHEEDAEQEAERAAPVRGRDGDQGDPDPDEDEREHGDGDPVRSHAAAARPAVTSTRHGACFRT